VSIAENGGNSWLDLTVSNDSVALLKAKMREHVGRLGLGATDGGDFPTIAIGVPTDFI
jgi:hypothetical protein